MILMDQDKKDNILDIILNSDLRSLGAIATEVISALNTQSDSTVIEDIILKDAALTAQIIRVANTSKYDTDTERRSLHEAVVRIGYDGLHSICICIGIVENIPLRHHDQRIMILECLHRCFETAVHAQNLSERLNGSTNKDAYIAGLLSNVGELAFLSSSMLNLKEYKELINTGLTPEMACLSLCGFDYSELSEQLVEKWELSTLINDAFNEVPATNEGKAVKMAYELTHAYHSGQSSKAFINASKRLVRDFGLSLKESVAFIEKGIEYSQVEFNKFRPLLQEKSNPYLSQTTKHGSRGAGNSASDKNVARPLDSEGQKSAINKFLDLAKKNSTIRVYYSILADALYGYTAFERVVIAEVIDNSKLKATNVVGAGTDSQELFSAFSFSFNFGESIISTIIETKEFLYLSKNDDPDTYDLIDNSIKTIADINGEFYLAPIIHNNVVTSIAYMDMGIKQVPISTEQIDAAKAMIEKLSNVLSIKPI